MKPAKQSKKKTVKPSKYLPILEDYETKLDLDPTYTVSRYAEELGVPVTTLRIGLKTARKQSQSLSTEQRSLLIASANRKLLKTALAGTHVEHQYIMKAMQNPDSIDEKITQIHAITKDARDRIAETAKKTESRNMSINVDLPRLIDGGDVQRGLGDLGKVVDVEIIPDPEKP